MFEAFGKTQCECEPRANEWIRLWFSDCVYSSWETVAFCIGLSSVMFWIVAQLPQFISNFRRQSADALSPWFLFQWLAGDSFNLLGCLLTGNQLATETVTATYFIFADCIIISQYIFYNIRANQKLELKDGALDSGKREATYQGVIEEPSPPVMHKMLAKMALSKLRCDVGDDGGDEESKLEAGKLYPFPQQQPRLTFVTGRSGASMIAHAMVQNPSSPRSPRPESQLKVPLIPQLTHLGTEGTRSSAMEHIVTLRRGFTRDSQALAPRIENAIPKRQRMQFPRQLPPPVPTGDRSRDDRSAHELRRDLRRVVAQYGLEYGPPSVSRLTIHHVTSLRKRGLEKRLSKSGKPPFLPTSKAKLVKAAACLAGVVMISASTTTDFLHPFSTRKAVYALDSYSMVAVGRKLLTICNENERLWWVKNLGVALGWGSSILYLGSRVSQIVKNNQRKSAEGLSLAMLTCAAMANVSYGTSIMMRATSWNDLVGKAPWLVGSLGTVLLDVSIVTQGKLWEYQWRKRRSEELTPLLA